MDKPIHFNRRLGDDVAIPGSYQFNAAQSRNPVQRFWHYAKKTAIDTYSPPFPNAFILDVGCGSGVISNYLAMNFHTKVIGIDSNKDAISFAKKNFPSAQFICRYVDDELTLHEQIDYIYCLELIEHIYPEQAKILLNNFYRLLKPKGKIFLTTPNYRSIWPLIEKVMDNLKLAPKLANDQHVTFYVPRDFVNLITNSGFTITHLGTNCMLAPWIAPFSYRAAQWINRQELQSKKLMGSIIIAVAEKST